LFTLGNESLHVNEAEFALRVMAKETRLSRRMLSKMVGDFWNSAFNRGAGSRIIASDAGVIYVVTCFTLDKSARQKFATLETLCFIARHVVGRGDLVVGIGFTPHGRQDRFTNVLSYFEVGEWTDEHSREAGALQAKLGIFKAPMQKVDAYEYPKD
jgi:hypothetical protein